MPGLFGRAVSVETASGMEVREIHVRPLVWVGIIFGWLVNLFDGLCSIRVARQTIGILAPQSVNILAGLSIRSVSALYSAKCLLSTNQRSNLNSNLEMDDSSWSCDIPGAMELIEAPGQRDKGHATPCVFGGWIIAHGSRPRAS